MTDNNQSLPGPNTEGKYSADPPWGGQPRFTSVPTHIYDCSPEPTDTADAQAKINILRRDLDDIKLQLSEAGSQGILADRFNWNTEEWERWKRSVVSCQRVKRAQLFVYSQWLNRVQQRERLESAPNTEAMRYAEKALSKAGSLEGELRTLKAQVSELEALLHSILGINNETPNLNPYRK